MRVGRGGGGRVEWNGEEGEGQDAQLNYVSIWTMQSRRKVVQLSLKMHRV